MVQIRIGTPTEQRTTLGGVLVIHLGCLFLQEEPESLGRLCIIVLAGVRAVWSSCSFFSYPSNAVCLDLCGAEGMLQPHPHILGLSQWCFLLSSCWLFLRGRAKLGTSYVAIFVTEGKYPSFHGCCQGLYLSEVFKICRLTVLQKQRAFPLLQGLF